MNMLNYIPGLTKKKLPSWTNKKWYHQGFDGSPYFLHIIAEAEVKKEQRKGDGYDKVHYCFFQEGKADWYILIDDITRVSTWVMKKKSLSYSQNLINQWNTDQ